MVCVYNCRKREYVIVCSWRGKKAPKEDLSDVKWLCSIAVYVWFLPTEWEYSKLNYRISLKNNKIGMKLLCCWPPQTDDETNVDLNPLLFLAKRQIHKAGMRGPGARLYKTVCVLHSESKDVSKSEEQQLEPAVRKTMIGSRKEGGRMHSRSHRITKRPALSEVPTKNDYSLWSDQFCKLSSFIFWLIRIILFQLDRFLRKYLSDVFPS